MCFCYLTIKYHFYHTFSSAVCIKSKKNESFFIEILNKNRFIPKTSILHHFRNIKIHFCAYKLTIDLT